MRTPSPTRDSGGMLVFAGTVKVFGKAMDVAGSTNEMYLSSGRLPVGGTVQLTYSVIRRGRCVQGRAQ